MKKRVFETCNKLVEKGIKPTLITVRTELGGGSFSTINPFVRQWKEERKMSGSQTTIELRHELASINRKAMDMIWKVTSDHYNKINKEQQNELLALRIYATQADATITKLRKELEEVKKEKLTLEGLLMMYYKNLKHTSSGKSFMT
jgi:hypothetical protein